MEELISGIRLIALFGIGLLAAMTLMLYLLADDDNKGAIGFWFIILVVCLWLVGMAAKTSSLY